LQTSNSDMSSYSALQPHHLYQHQLQQQQLHQDPRSRVKEFVASNINAGSSIVQSLIGERKLASYATGANYGQFGMDGCGGGNIMGGLPGIGGLAGLGGMNNNNNSNGVIGDENQAAFVQAAAAAAQNSGAFLGPKIWDKTISFDDDFKLEYMDLDEFLTENDLPLETVLQEQQQIDEEQQQLQQRGNPMGQQQQQQQQQLAEQAQQQQQQQQSSSKAVTEPLTSRA
jgi:hypothetical protein